METFRVKALPASVTCTLELSGEADLAFAPDIIELGTAALAEAGIKVLFIDLAAVTFIDSAALGAFVHLRNLAIEQNKSFVLLEISPRVLQVLSLSGLDKVFRVPSP